MELTKELKDKIVNEVSRLENIDDSVGIAIGDNKGLFIQLVDYGEGKEYFIELNDIEEDNVYEPCKEYNAFAEFGDMENLIKNIEQYLA